MGLRERKKIRSRQKIMSAAVKCFDERGYSETSIADIMNEAGLGVGTFYNYFASKEELLLAMLERIEDELIDLAKAEKHSPLTALEKINKRTAQLLDENKFVLPLFLSASEHADRPELWKKRVRPGFKPVFEEIIGLGQDAGDIRADVSSDLIAEMFHSIYHSAALSGMPIPFQTNVQLKVQLLLDGIKTDRG